MTIRVPSDVGVSSRAEHSGDKTERWGGRRRSDTFHLTPRGSVHARTVMDFHTPIISLLPFSFQRLGHIAVIPVDERGGSSREKKTCS